MTYLLGWILSTSLMRAWNLRKKAKITVRVARFIMRRHHHFQSAKRNSFTTASVAAFTVMPLISWWNMSVLISQMRLKNWFLLSFILRFSTSCYGCHQFAPHLGVSQQVSTTYPSKPALSSFWGCLPHPEVEFHARLVTFLSCSVLSVTTVYYGSHQLAPDPRVPQQVSSIYPSEPAICSFWGGLTHLEVEFDAMLVTFFSSFALRFTTSFFGCHQLGTDLCVPLQVSTIYP